MAAISNSDINADSLPEVAPARRRTDGHHSALGRPSRSIEITEAFREHRTLVHSIARRYCGDQAAADVTQEVFVRLWNHPDRFDAARGTIRQYLVTLTRGIAIDHLRRESARLNRDTRHGTSPEGPERQSAARLIDQETTSRVIAALGQLQHEERRAIVTAFYNEASYREVALLLGVPEGTVKSRIRVGLRRLRAELSLDLDDLPNHTG